MNTQVDHQAPYASRRTADNANARRLLNLPVKTNLLDLGFELDVWARSAPLQRDDPHRSQYKKDASSTVRKRKHNDPRRQAILQQWASQTTVDASSRVAKIKWESSRSEREVIARAIMAYLEKPDSRPRPDLSPAVHASLPRGVKAALDNAYLNETPARELFLSANEPSRTTPVASGSQPGPSQYGGNALGITESPKGHDDSLPGPSRLGTVQQRSITPDRSQTRPDTGPRRQSPSRLGLRKEGIPGVRFDRQFFEPKETRLSESWKNFMHQSSERLAIQQDIRQALLKVELPNASAADPERFYQEILHLLHSYVASPAAGNAGPIWENLAPYTQMQIDNYREQQSGKVRLPTPEMPAAGSSTTHRSVVQDAAGSQVAKVLNAIPELRAWLDDANRNGESPGSAVQRIANWYGESQYPDFNNNKPLKLNELHHRTFPPLPPNVRRLEWISGEWSALPELTQLPHSLEQVNFRRNPIHTIPESYFDERGRDLMVSVDKGNLSESLLAKIEKHNATLIAKDLKGVLFVVVSLEN